MAATSSQSQFDLREITLATLRPSVAMSPPPGKHRCKGDGFSTIQGSHPAVKSQNMLAGTIAILVSPWFFLCKGKQNIFEELWPYSPFQEHTPLNWIHEGTMLLHWTDCSPAIMLLLSTSSGWASKGWSNGKICGLCDQALSTQALQDHAPVSFISEKSLPPQICPVPSLHLLSISFFNRHISLLLTNNQSDWFDSWYDQVCRKQDPFPGSEGMEDRLFFFQKKKKKKLTIWSTCHW